MLDTGRRLVPTGLYLFVRSPIGAISSRRVTIHLLIPWEDEFAFGVNLASGSLFAVSFRAIVLPEHLSIRAVRHTYMYFDFYVMCAHKFLPRSLPYT